MLTIRKRGKYFHVRGSIRVGRETRVIKEHSCGTDRRDDANDYKAKLEADIRHEILHGPGGRTHSLTIADAGLRYIGRPGGLRTYDLWRLDQINAVVGDYTIAGGGCMDRIQRAVRRDRTDDRAAVPLNVSGCNQLSGGGRRLRPAASAEAAKGRADRSKSISGSLTDVQADRLVQDYADHVRPIAITLRWQGLRIGEARCGSDGTHVEWKANSIFIAESKNGEASTVAMHKHVAPRLHELFVAQGSPVKGRYFLNSAGRAVSRSATLQVSER